MNLAKKDFPTDFLFGAATSAYQIEGTNFGGVGRTHWDQFSAIKGNVVNGENGSAACEHYNCFEEDLDLMRGLQAYRFSTNWARILPDGVGQVNQAGLDFYDRLVDAILERELKPFLTLYHWDLPATLADKGGWQNSNIANWFADYAEIVLAKIGDRIETVATINEPWCVAWLSHFEGHHAPGLRDIKATALAMHHVLLAHAKALERLRSLKQKNLGIVLNFEHAQSLDTSPKSIEATATFDAIFNRWFAQAIFHGTYPKEALEGLAPHLPQNWEKDLKTINQPIDWLGVNYYTRQILSHDPNAPWPHYKSTPGPMAKTAMDWEIFPQGLGDVLQKLKEVHVGSLPLYVTENGMAGIDCIQDGEISDADRWSFIQHHLRQVHTAIKNGINVKGFFYWSLLDNYEWAHGYEKRFGLVHVDFSTQKRTPKSSYNNYMRNFSDQT